MNSALPQTGPVTRESGGPRRFTGCHRGPGAYGGRNARMDRAVPSASQGRCHETAAAPAEPCRVEFDRGPGPPVLDRAGPQRRAARTPQADPLAAPYRRSSHGPRYAVARPHGADPVGAGVPAGRIPDRGDRFPASRRRRRLHARRPRPHRHPAQGDKRARAPTPPGPLAGGRCPRLFMAWMSQPRRSSCNEWDIHIECRGTDDASGAPKATVRRFVRYGRPVVRWPGRTAARPGRRSGPAGRTSPRRTRVPPPPRAVPRTPPA